MQLISKKIVGALVLVTMFTGGCKYLDSVTANTIKADLSLILPEYKDYVQDDPTKDTDEKKDRVRLADELEKLVDEATK